MNQAKRKKVEMIVGLILVVISFLSFAYPLLNPVGNGFSIELVVTMITLLSIITAGIYIATEFKKSSAKLFKLFLYAFSLDRLVDTLVAVEFRSTIVSLLCPLLVFVILNILLWVDNLGKTKSVILSTLAFVLDLLVPVCFFAVQVDNSLTGINAVIVTFAHMTLSLILVMMVHLKYVDKEMRNAK